LKLHKEVLLREKNQVRYQDKAVQTHRCNKLSQVKEDLNHQEMWRKKKAGTAEEDNISKI
jgi:hypothetical protein